MGGSSNFYCAMRSPRVSPVQSIDCLPPYHTWLTACHHTIPDRLPATIRAAALSLVLAEKASVKCRAYHLIRTAPGLAICWRPVLGQPGLAIFSLACRKSYIGTPTYDSWEQFLALQKGWRLKRQLRSWSQALISLPRLISAIELEAHNAGGGFWKDQMEGCRLW